MMILDPQLGINPTRSSVARFRRFRPAGWEIQTTPISDPLIVQENKTKMDDFFRTHNAHTETIGGTTHLFIRNCPTIDVINLIRDINTIGTNWDSSYFLEYLERLQLQLGVLPSMDVVFMQEGTLRVRALDSNGHIDQLMQGRSTNYPGDREIHDDKVQLQVHYVQCQVNQTNTTRTTALALYIPNQPQFDLSFIIRGEEQ
jgi:hypothetical protein